MVPGIDLGATHGALANAPGPPPRDEAPPAKVLLNGGLLCGAAIRTRALEALHSWLPQPAPQQLAFHVRERVAP